MPVYTLLDEFNSESAILVMFSAILQSIKCCEGSMNMLVIYQKMFLPVHNAREFTRHQRQAKIIAWARSHQMVIKVSELFL